MDAEHVFPFVVFHVAGVPVYDTVVVTWALMAVIAGLSWLASRNLRDRPPPLQNMLEAIVEAMEGLIAEVTPFEARRFLPLVGTLGVYLFASNLIPVIPGVGAPTRDINTTSALAAIVFLSVHYFGIRLVGARRYLRTYLEPSWFLLPFNIIGEVTRTVALSLRLFGNMLSGAMVAAILLILAGFLVPVPMQLLGVLIGVIQAYVFTLLAMVYIAAGLRADEGPGGIES